MYDVSKENDKQFLREAVALLQDKLLMQEFVILELRKLKEKDQEILQKISEELKSLRKKVFGSKQEKKANSAKNKKKKRKKKPSS